MKDVVRGFVRIGYDDFIFYDLSQGFIHPHWYMYKHREVGLPDTLDLLAVL